MHVETNFPNPLATTFNLRVFLLLNLYRLKFYDLKINTHTGTRKYVENLPRQEIKFVFTLF